MQELNQIKGYVHSFESFGTVDGPGIRFVVFLQGCPLRCQYCHNPDTWKTNVGDQYSANEIFKKYQSVKHFLKNGGLTVTGGEPLLQMDFLIELFKLFKKNDVHTCLDTSGITFNKNNTEKFDELMKYCDLVMLDIKHIDNKKHKDLTGQENTKILDFAQYLCEIKKPVWIRHVLVPGITNNQEQLENLGYFIGGLNNMKALDVLPYHKMGKVKYEQLGIIPPLKNVPEATKDEAELARAEILKGIKKRLIEIKYGKQE